ncbi:Uncharacterised protein [Vibrio cholerae]|nr:Uncharacterised protein [Vibrio cholerae]
MPSDLVNVKPISLSCSLASVASLVVSIPAASSWLPIVNCSLLSASAALILARLGIADSNG